MKTNKVLIFLILTLQGFCGVVFAQSGLGTTPCNGGVAKRFGTIETHQLPSLNGSTEPGPDTGDVLITDPVPVDGEFPYPGLEYSQGIYRIEHNPSNTAVIQSTQPVDPNEIIGLEGYNAPESEDTLRWVAATQSLAYTIYFENDPELAMAAASKVTITMPVHPKLNYATFGVGSFGFGSYVFPVNGLPSSYQTRIDLRDSMGIYLDVVAGLDIVNHEAFWIFQSIDPATGLPPADIHLGFLPINDSLHSGEGFVSFTIKPKAGECVTGDTATATASIVFDINEPIATNTWLHTIDAVAPTSTLAMTPNAAADTLMATFTGEDDAGGCGIKQYKLYYSVNDNAYQLYNVYPAGETAKVPVETGMEYRFFVLAEDHVGNCEPMKSQPEYSIGTNFVTLAVNAIPQDAGTVAGAGSYSVNDHAQLIATAAEGYHFVNWMNQGVPVSTQNPYTVEVTQNQNYTAFFERNAYTLQTLAAAGSTITVTDMNGNEVPSGSTVFHADRIVVQTFHETCYDLIGGSANGVAFISGDTLTVTGDLAITTLTNPLLSTSDTFAIVCNSFDWYEHTNLIQSGDYAHTFTNAEGCDSVVILHLTVNHTTYGDTAAVACDSFDWYEHTDIMQSCEDLTHIFTNAAGCDSVVTLHLTVNHPTTGSDEQMVCDSLTWLDGITYYESTEMANAPTYTYAGGAANGCDSIVTLYLTVNHTTYGDTVAVACNSFDWYGNTYTASGDYLHTLTNVNGCDSIATLHLTVNHTTYGDTAAVACNSFDWYGNTYTASGDYSHTLTNAIGCDSIVTLHLTVNHTTYGDTAAVACNSFDWYGNTYTTSGDYSRMLTNANDCDSIFTLHLIVNHTTYGDTAVAVCDSFNWYGNTYTTSGDYSHMLTNANGCDSIVTLHLTVNHLTYGDTSAVACDSLDWYGNTYTASGDYLYTLTNANGCDSIVTLHLTVNHTTYGDAAAVACNSFDWYGNTYTASGDYLHTLTNANGCDSIVTLHLTISYTAYGDTVAVACDSMEWFGNMYTASGDYPVALTNANGCDSIITLHLTVNHPSTGIDEHEVCDSLTWLDGITYYESTNAPTYTLSNALGCDSVVNLHLTINESISSEFNIVTEDSCYIWNNQTYCETGDYVQTFETMYGCDSVVTLHLTITVGVNDYNGLEFKLYPNPTKDVVNIHLTVNNEQLRGVEIQVFDMYGKLLDIVNVGNTDAMNSIPSNTQIDLSKYASGVYLVKAVVGGNVLAVRKVVKNR